MRAVGQSNFNKSNDFSLNDSNQRSFDIHNSCMPVGKEQIRSGFVSPGPGSVPDKLQFHVRLLAVLQGGEGLQDAVRVELGLDIAVLEAKLVASFKHFDLFEWSHLERMLGRIQDFHMRNVQITITELLSM